MQFASQNVSALSAGSLQPRVLQPRGMKLDGGDATMSRFLALGSHVISWQPPASGKVSAYRLRLLQYQVENGRARRKGSVSFAVEPSATSVQLPSDVLKPAHTFRSRLAMAATPVPARPLQPLPVVAWWRPHVQLAPASPRPHVARAHAKGHQALDGG